MGATEIIFIFVIYLLFFGAKGVPSLARTMGKAMREFKHATNDIQREILDGANDLKKGVQDVNPMTEVKSAANTFKRQVNTTVQSAIDNSDAKREQQKPQAAETNSEDKKEQSISAQPKNKATEDNSGLTEK